MKTILSLALILCLLLAALPLGASAYSVVLSPQNLEVDGVLYDCEKYNIDGSNYFKLRDLAALLTGTPAQFAVSWDAAANAVVLAPGLPYESIGGELEVGEDKSASAVPSAQTVWFLDAPADGLSVYNIGGNNFFKLRDLGELMGFTVDYDAGTNTAIVRSGPTAAFDTLRVPLPDFVAHLRHFGPGGVVLWVSALDDEGYVLSRDHLLFADPRDLRLQDPALSVDLDEAPDVDGEQVLKAPVSVSAPAFGIRLELPGVPALFDDNAFALEPDETLEIHVTPLERADPAALRRLLRARSLFDLARADENG